MTQSFIAEVVVTHPDLPLTPTIREAPNIDVQFESQPSHRDSPSLFYTVSDSDFRGFETALASDHTVDDWRVSIELADCRIYQVTPSAEAKFTTPRLTELGIRLLSIRNVDRGWRFQLQAPDKASLRAYWDYCREEGVEFQLEKLYMSGPHITAADSERLASRLTDRQLEVVHAAVRMGYFEPDGAGADEVAEELGISPSTLSTHIRRIMAKVFEYIDENRHPR